MCIIIIILFQIGDIIVIRQGNIRNVERFQAYERVTLGLDSQFCHFDLNFTFAQGYFTRFDHISKNWLRSLYMFLYGFAKSICSQFVETVLILAVRSTALLSLWKWTHSSLDMFRIEGTWRLFKGSLCIHYFEV